MRAAVEDEIAETARNPITRPWYNTWLSEMGDEPGAEWMADLARKRIERGRVVLVENGWTSDALELDCIASLEGCRDGLTGDPFEFVRVVRVAWKGRRFFLRDECHRKMWKTFSVSLKKSEGYEHISFGTNTCST